MKAQGEEATRGRRERVKKMAAPLLNNRYVQYVGKRYPNLAAKTKKIAKNILGTDEVIQKEYQDSFNAHLAGNYAEHNQLLNDNKAYYYESESTSKFARNAKDPRLVAVYLPQFHPFKENDEAWGKGFTEWTNVTASFPRFVGQQQPVLPSDLGFYDLRLPLVIKQQIDLAKKYGIYGFQFYYYWFSGKKVMDMPINTILENKDWDFNFSICWANENWTRKWDGGDNEIIFEQKNLSDDPLRFIQDVSPILNDPRYIHENGKPMLTVYRVELLDDPRSYVKAWRKYFRDTFQKELWLVGHTYDATVNPLKLGFDATMDFTPIGSLQPTLKPWVDDRKYLTDDIISRHKLLDQNWRGNVIDFRFIAKQEIDNLRNNKNFYKTVSPSWSNEARRKGNDGYTFLNASPEIFANWLDKILSYDTTVLKKESPIVFLNAWNEWAEAAMIEPSTHLGHNTLLRTAETLARHSNNKTNKKTFSPYKLQCSVSAKLAIVVHLYYPEMWEKISKALQVIDVEFDIFVSVPDGSGVVQLEKISKFHKYTNIVTVPNRGRDVLPFVTLTNRIRAAGNYEYLLKLHTKKSKHRNDGDVWFDDLLTQLLPEAGVDKILKTLKKSDTGLIGPANHVVSLSRHMGGNRQAVQKLSQELSGKEYEALVEDERRYPFFGSTMFWCRMDALTPLLDLYLMPSDFESEQGQIDGTLAHAIERVLGGVLHAVNGRRMYTVNHQAMVAEISNDTLYDQKYQFAE